MSIPSNQSSSPASGRICPYCAEPLQPAAKLCPRCRQWLTLRSLRNPAIFTWVVGGLLMAVLLAFGLALISRMERVLDPKPLYTTQPDALRILDSRMAWRQTTSERRLQVVGIMTNQTEIPWSHIEFECRFFDTKGALIDVAHSIQFLTVQPHDDAGFSLLVYTARPTNMYASHSVIVTTARSARGLF